MYKYVIKKWEGGMWTPVFGPEDITIVYKKLDELTKNRTVNIKISEPFSYFTFRYFGEEGFCPPEPMPDITAPSDEIISRKGSYVGPKS